MVGRRSVSSNSDERQMLSKIKNKKSGNGRHKEEVETTEEDIKCVCIKLIGIVA